MTGVIPKLSPNWKLGSVRSTYDKTTIRYALYKKLSETLDCCVVFLNGRSEWIEKYDYIPDLLDLPKNCGFLTWDHRGQGASEGTRYHVDSFDQFAEDSQAVIQSVLKDIPIFLIGHSTGGLIGLYATLKSLISPEAIALSSPLLMLPDKPVGRNLSRPIAHTLTKMGMSKVRSGEATLVEFSENQLTHCYEGFQRIEQAPYGNQSPTMGWIDAAFEATEFVFDETVLGSYTTPTLVLGGSEEEIVDPEGFQEWVRIMNQCSPTVIKYASIQGARHEILNEIPRLRDKAIELINHWIREYLS